MIFSTLVRRIFNPVFVNQSKSLLNLPIQDPNFELTRISNLGRHNSGKTNLIQKGFRFIDSESFIYQYNEIFLNHFLSFETDSPHPLILDCGSNIGVSVSYFQQSYPSAKIIAFEPDPEIFECLSLNSQNGRESNIELHNKAVWTEDTWIDFKTDGADGGKIDKSGNCKVQSVNLSMFLQQKVDMLKVDIEGAEAFVLPAISNYLKNVKNLFLELHITENQPELLEQTIRILRENGFVYKINAVGRLDFKSFKKQRGYSMQLNIFAVNENS
tara:strand:- start:2313 stop:3125 length:813 start_codon:yes stop_codon:yes gene_type:complete